MKERLVSAETSFKIEFFDVDSMNIVWHGNYVKFMEVGRCTLLDKIGYNYIAMRKDGFAFPIVEVKVKYVRPLVFNETAVIKSFLVEYENRLKIEYEIYNARGELATKAESTQMVVNGATGETMFVCPPHFIEKVQRAISLGG